MQYYFEHFAVSTAAITGVLAARGKQVDLFAVIVLALVTALGGGTIRDLILRAEHVFWLDDTRFLLNAVVTAVVAFFLVRFRALPVKVLLVADAFALALFTMVGTRKGLAVSGAPEIAIIMGVMTGVAGGILRDLLIGEIPLVFRREIYLYATAAICGASFFVLLRRFSDHAQVNMILGTSVTLILRLAGIRWRIGLPLFRPKDAPPSDPV
ncbi:MAG: trimeric intracellular cation channel family protein [Verrucomicrobiota bacterium]